MSGHGAVFQSRNVMRPYKGGQKHKKKQTRIDDFFHHGKKLITCLNLIVKTSKAFPYHCQRLTFGKILSVSWNSQSIPGIELSFLIAFTPIVMTSTSTIEGLHRG